MFGRRKRNRPEGGFPEEYPEEFFSDDPEAEPVSGGTERYFSVREEIPPEEFYPESDPEEEPED